MLDLALDSTIEERDAPLGGNAAALLAGGESAQRVGGRYSLWNRR